MNFQILVKHQKSAILLTTWQSLKVITVYINIRSIMLGATLELYSRILGLELYLTSEDVLELRIDICQMFKLFLFVYFSISVFNISSVVQHKPISESISLRWMHKTQRNNAVFDFQSEILSPVDFMLPNLSSSFFLNFEWSWFEFRFFLDRRRMIPNKISWFVFSYKWGTCNIISDPNPKSIKIHPRK